MQRRRRYDLKLSGLTGHVLDLFLLLTNSPSHYWICLQLIWLTGWETLCAAETIYGNEYLVCSFGTL